MVPSCLKWQLVYEKKNSELQPYPKLEMAKEINPDIKSGIESQRPLSLHLLQYGNSHSQANLKNIIPCILLDHIGLADQEGNIQSPSRPKL